MTSTTSTVDGVEFVPADPDDAESVNAMAAYFDELNTTFVDGFDPGDALTAGGDAYRSPSGAFVLARRTGADGDKMTEVLGCGAVQRVDDHTAEIKRMWVSPSARGIGLGRTLLGHLEGVVAELGYTRIVLDTNDSLHTAIAMYEGAGYHRIERYNDNPYARLWFEKRLSPPPARSRS